MHETIDFLIEHGYTVLFAWVLVEQLGLPIPSLPLLLAAGALAGAGKFSFPMPIALAVLACMIADLLWYELGRRRGGKILGLLCRISLEPESCVRRTEDAFQNHASRSLLLAKFVPGLNTAAPPMAGMTGMRLPRFLLLDSLGALFYAGGAVLVGISLQREAGAPGVLLLAAGECRGRSAGRCDWPPTSSENIWRGAASSATCGWPASAPKN